MRPHRPVAALLAAAAALAVPAQALAAGPLGTGPFGLVPSPGPGGQPRPYFSLAIAPGGSATEAAVVSNEGRRRLRLRITVSRGVTALNSGSAFQPVTGRCGGADCWLTGLPRTVTLAAGERKALYFRVRVPAGTPRAQYLAGLTAEPAVRPRPVKVGSNGHASARAIIIDQVTNGVAVTVGSLARLRTAVRISPVTAGWVGSTARLFIPVRNTGQTFAQATGPVSCAQSGRRHSYRVIMETVLPGGRAVLPVNAPGLAAGTIACAVRLRDPAGDRFTWSGQVRVPSRVRTRMVHVARGVYAALPQNTVPPWAIALMIIGALILATMLAQILLRRQRAGQPVRLRRRSAP